MIKFIDRLLGTLICSSIMLIAFILRDTILIFLGAFFFFGSILWDFKPRTSQLMSNMEESDKFLIGYGKVFMVRSLLFEIFNFIDNE